jgi:hypothetical protein
MFTIPAQRWVGKCCLLPLDEASPNVALIALHKHHLALWKRLAVDMSSAVKNLLGSSRKTVYDRLHHYA